MLLFKDKINGLENVWTILLMLNYMWQVIKMWNLTYYSILRNNSQVHWQVNRVFGWKVPKLFNLQCIVTTFNLHHYHDEFFDYET